MRYNKNPLRQARNPNSQLPISDEKVKDIVKNLGIYQPSQELEATIRVVGAVTSDMADTSYVDSAVEEINESINITNETVDVLSSSVSDVTAQVQTINSTVSSLGSAAFSDKLEFATSSQGSAADTAVQPQELFAESSRLQQEIDSLSAGQSTSALYFDTKVDMDSATGEFVNQGAFVTNGADAGQYKWNGTSWDFLRADTLSQKADVSLVLSRTSHVEEVNNSLSDYTAVPNVIVGPNKARSRTTGLEITQTGYQYSGYDVNGDEMSIRATGYVNHSGVALAVYFDQSDTFLGMQYPGGAGNEPFEHVNQVLTPPSGTRKIYISTNTAFPTQLKFETKGVALDVAKRLKEVETTTGEIGSIKEAVSGWVTQTTTTVDGAYLSKSNGNTVANNGFIYTKFEVSPEDSVRVSARVQGPAVALAVYYSNPDGTGYIGYEVDGTGLPVDYVNRELNVPITARCIGVVSRVGFPITVQKIGVVEDLAARVEAIESSANEQSSISLFGDSMIADAATGIAPELSAALPSRIIYKQGIGGQDALQVAARMGARELFLKVEGGIIPSTGTVNCVPSIDLLRRSGGIATCKVMVQGVLCGLTFDFSMNGGTGGYYLTPVVYPANNVVVTENVQAMVLSGWVSGTSTTACIPLGTLLGGTVIVRVDRNDADPSNTVEDVLLQNQSIVKQIQRFTNKWIWMGTTNGYSDKTVQDGGTRTSPESSYAYLSRVESFNNANKELYSTNFLDVMANHISLGGSQLYTVLARTFNVLDSSILSDGVHENTLGKNRTVKLVTDLLSKNKW